MTAAYFDQIEQFLDGELSKEDLQKLVPAIDPQQLERDIAQLRNMRTAVEAAGLRDQLKEGLPKAEAKPAKVRSLVSWRRALSIAASILLLLSIYWFLPRGEEGGLYAKYEFVDPGLPVLMSQSDHYDLYDALSYYSEENYKTAINKLSALQTQGMTNDTLSFYLGASQLYEGQVLAARENLTLLSTTANSFQERAEWLLVLATLKENDPAAARSLATRILEKEAHPFYKDAQSLLADLNAQ